MARYCGMALYFSNSAAHCAPVSGGNTPATGCHSVMDRPDSVRRVMPPMTTMSKIMAQQAKSQRAIGRSTLAARGAVSERVREDKAPLACIRFDRRQTCAWRRRLARAEGRQSVKLEGDTGVPQFARRDDRGACHVHGMELPLDVVRPEVEETAQHGIVRRHVEMLPDEALQHVRMIRHVIEDLRRGHAVAVQLQAKVTHQQMSPCSRHIPSTSVQSRSASIKKKLMPIKGLAACLRDCCQIRWW